MPSYQDVDPDIKAMQGIHLYQYFLSNCSQRGVTGIQPWYAHLMCLALRFKSRLRRSGPAPMKPRLAA